MNSFWIFLTGLCIASQLPHAYWAIEDFSIIKNQKVRILQNISFCLILSFMVLGFVLEGLHLYAFGGALVEIVINFYYFQQGMYRMDSKTKKRKWLRHVLAIIIPMGVFICSLMIKV